MTSLTSSSTAKSSRLDSLRSVVEAAKKSGLVYGPGQARPVPKDGAPATAEGALRTQWIDVTPGIARRWLDNNFRNRPISEDVVASYARDMVNGVWVATHQGVAFNDRDELIDGQHRLHAVIRAEKTVRMMVTFGLPSRIEGAEMTTMDAVDRGRTRSVSDQLRIQHGLKDGGAIAQICTALGALCYPHRTRRLTVGQTLEIYRAFEPAVMWVIKYRPKEHGLGSRGVLAAFAFALMSEHGQPDTLTPLFAQLTAGQDQRARVCPAIAQLREFLLSDAAKLLNRGTDRGVAELVLQALWLALQKSDAKLELAQDGWTFFRARQTARVEKIAAIFALPETEVGR